MVSGITEATTKLRFDVLNALVDPGKSVEYTPGGGDKQLIPQTPVRLEQSAVLAPKVGNSPTMAKSSFAVRL